VVQWCIVDAERDNRALLRATTFYLTGNVRRRNGVLHDTRTSHRSHAYLCAAGGRIRDEGWGGFQVHAERGQVVRVPQLDLPLMCSPPPADPFARAFTPFRHAALRRIRRNLTVQVLFAMPADPGTGSHIRMMQRPRLAYVLDSLPGIPAEHRDADRRNDPRYGVHLVPP